jgi:hypothetical protein
LLHSSQLGETCPTPAGAKHRALLSVAQRTAERTQAAGSDGWDGSAGFEGG